MYINDLETESNCLVPVQSIFWLPSEREVLTNTEMPLKVRQQKRGGKKINNQENSHQDVFAPWKIEGWHSTWKAGFERKRFFFPHMSLYDCSRWWDGVSPCSPLYGGTNEQGVEGCPLTPLGGGGAGSNSPLWKRFRSVKSILQGEQGKNPGCFLQIQSVLCLLLKDTDGVEAAVICSHLPSGDWCPCGVCGPVGWKAGSLPGTEPAAPTPQRLGTGWIRGWKKSTGIENRLMAEPNQ